MAIYATLRVSMQAAAVAGERDGIVNPIQSDRPLRSRLRVVSGKPD
jgi:hypothetical protein